jgi:hypothetical protein
MDSNYKTGWNRAINYTTMDPSKSTVKFYTGATPDGVAWY